MATRNERVVLTLQDDFTGGMARAAAATELLNRQLGRLDDSTVRSSRSSRALGSQGLPGVEKSSRRTGSEVDKLSGRMRILADVAATLGPALVPIGAVGVAGVAGLSNQLGFAVVAAGSAVIAFQGLGTALKDLNTARLEPTAMNIDKARAAMGQLSPAAQELARQVAGLSSTWDSLRSTAAGGLFPGLSDGIRALETRMPDVQALVGEIDSALGSLFRQGAKNLASSDWDSFFTFLENEAVPTLVDMGKAAGNVAAGFAHIWVAFAPLNRSFSDWAVRAAQDFERWAQGLGDTQGFQDFVDYIRENGPRVADTLGSLGNALVQIVEAAAPLGGPALDALREFANILAAIADSPLGTPIFATIAALAALNRVTATWTKVSTGAFGSKVRSEVNSTFSAMTRSVTEQERATMSATQLARVHTQRVGAFVRTGTALAATGLIASGAADKFHLANTATLALAGAMTGAGPFGAAAGGLIGGVMDLKNALEPARDATADAASQLKYLQSVIASGGPTMSGQIAALREQISLLHAQNQAVQGSSAGGLAKGAYSAQTTQQVNALQGAIGNLVSQRDLQRQQAFIDSMHRESVAAHQTAQSFLDFGDNLDDAKVSLNQWIHSLAQQAQALRNFRVNAETAANNGLKEGLIKQLEAAGPVGALRMKQLANATQSEIARANAAWTAGRRQMQLYADQATQMTRHQWRIKIGVDAAGANAIFDGLEYRLNRLSHRVRIPVHAANAVASGGYIAGPGTSTSDSIPAWLSNGEYVVKAAAVQKYGLNMMQDLNEMRLANGGWASRQAPSYTYNTTYHTSEASGAAPAAYFSDDAVKVLKAFFIAALRKDASELSAGRRSSGV